MNFMQQCSTGATAMQAQACSSLGLVPAGYNLRICYIKVHCMMASGIVLSLSYNSYTDMSLNSSMINSYCVCDEMLSLVELVVNRRFEGRAVELFFLRLWGKNFCSAVVISPHRIVTVQLSINNAYWN